MPPSPGPLAPAILENLRSAEVTLHGYVAMGLDATGEPLLVAVLHCADLWIGVEVEADETWSEEESGGRAASDLFVYTRATLPSVFLGLEDYRRMEPFTDRGTPPGREGFLSAEVRSAIAGLPVPKN